MKSLIKSILHIGKRPGYSPLITVEISASALRHNYEEFKKLTNKPIAPVLKSNAYGHGLVEVATIVQKFSPPFIVIDSLFEAFALRSQEIQTPLLIIGYTRPEDMLKTNLRNISFAITSTEALKEIKDAKKEISIHLKIDTGMHRQGILESDIDKCFSLITNNARIRLDGICSHFADADTTESTATEYQIIIWNSIVKKVREKFPNTKYFHISNSAGHAYESWIDSTVSRLGIGLYGLDASDSLSQKIVEKPAMTIKTIISSIKKIAPGDAVGYNGTFKAAKEMTIATIPMGYFEGIDRRLSNKGVVYVKEIPCPLLGRVSMNISTIDVSEITDLNLNDEVEIISDTTSKENSIVSIAKTCETIAYEIAVHIPQHLKRVVVD